MLVCSTIPLRSGSVRSVPAEEEHSLQGSRRGREVEFALRAPSVFSHRTQTHVEDSAVRVRAIVLRDAAHVGIAAPAVVLERHLDLVRGGAAGAWARTALVVGTCAQASVTGFEHEHHLFDPQLTAAWDEGEHAARQTEPCVPVVAMVAVVVVVVVVVAAAVAALVIVLVMEAVLVVVVVAGVAALVIVLVM